MNKKIILIMVLASIVYTLFSAISITENLTEWWDSAEYLLLAKSWVKGTPTTGFAPHRELAPAVLWYPFFLTGLNEYGIKVFMLLMGLANVYMSYLLMKRMYNERTGLFVSFMMAVFYMNHFYTTRLTMYVLAPLMFQAAIYFFWGYYQNKKIKDLIISFLIIGVGMTVYYNTAFVLLIIGAFFVLTNKMFFKDFNYWKAGIITLLVLTPYFIYSYSTYGHPIPRLAAVQKAYATEAGGGFAVWDAYLKLIPSMLSWPIFIFMIAGILMNHDLFFGIDQVFKETYKENLNDLFLYIWIIIPLILYTLSAMNQGQAGVGVVLPAYIMILFPPFFVFVSKAVYFVYDFLFKHKKTIATLFILSIIMYFGYLQLDLSAGTFFNKLYSFSEVREAGDLIQRISTPDDLIVSASVPQLVYYSERDVMGIAHNAIEEEWHKEVLERRPKYLFLTRYEPHPAWISEYPIKHNMTAIMVFGPDLNNPVAILFEFNYQE